MSGAQITLITGQPGSGKTAKTVHMIQDEIAKGRVVFVLGIPGLTLPFVPMPPVKEWTVKRSVKGSDFLLSQQLKARKPEKYRERSAVEHSGQVDFGDVDAKLKRKLDAALGEKAEDQKAS